MIKVKVMFRYYNDSMIKKDQTTQERLFAHKSHSECFLLGIHHRMTDVVFNIDEIDGLTPEVINAYKDGYHSAKLYNNYFVMEESENGRDLH